MNYIIDPSVFYWMKVVNELHDAAFAIGVLLLIAGGVLFFACAIESDFDSHKKAIVIIGVIGCLLLLASVFIPTKESCVEMLISRTATFDNANLTIQQIKELVDYVVGALKGV